MKKIIIIGGEENILGQYKKKLADMDCQVTLVCDLEDGENKIREEKPDLIVLDTNTPKEDESRFLEKCRKEHQDIPFVLCTSHGNAKQSFSVWASHAHVIKSANFQELKTTIKTVLK